MKRIVVVVGLLALAAAAVSAGGRKESSGAEKQYRIGFVQLIDNLTFKEMRDGFYARMAERGYGQERALITYKDAQGDMATLNTICQEMAGGNYDAVVTLATPATQAFVNLESPKPVIFISVVDPVAAGIMAAMDKPNKNATGTSNYIPVDSLFELADKITPGIKTYGFIYNLGETNAVLTIKRAKEYLAERGIAYQEITVSNSSEVQQAAEALARRVDSIFIPNDSLVVQAMPQIVETANNEKIPVYGTALTHVNGGALATVGISDFLIGARSADMLIEYLEGKPIASIPAVTFDNLYTIINDTTAQTLGITIPQEFAGATRISK
ncbi:MAG: ABC transporter substrate-binding protein [Spirochaetaceae bacterium]|nr:ABC transporter substrate-binding protein [Spirochaetaceae bacterium]